MDDATLLAAEPPHWAARGLAHLLLAVFATTVAAAALVRVPEAVTGRFVLVPVGGTDPVRAPRAGVITMVHAAEGRGVARGVVLFHIRSEAVGDRWAELQTLRLRVAGATESERNAQRQYDAERATDAQEARRLAERAAYLERAIGLKQGELALARELAERRAQGRARGVVSGDDDLAAQTQVRRLESEIEQTRNELAETRAAAEKLRSVGVAREATYAEQRRALAAQQEEARVRVGPLEGELARTAAGGSELAIVAPCAGTIVRLHVRAADAVVRDGDALGEVACAGSALRADVTLPAEGIPLVQRGQRVKLFYDAFPYQRYGVRYGTVRWSGPTSGVATDSGAFRALVDVDGRPVVVQGRPRPLLPGMGGRARVLVDRRALISYAFEPIRQLREHLDEGPGR